MSKHLVTLLLLWGAFLLTCPAPAQHMVAPHTQREEGYRAETLHTYEPGDSEQGSTDSTLSIRTFFTKGHFEGHIRNYTMATTNKGALSDYWSNATGGAVHYTTATYHGLQLGVAWIFTFHTLGPDLTTPDSISGKLPKWELELYDVSRPGVGKDLDRLEELWLYYERPRWNIRIGKQNINKGPLLLARDGRMKPFVYRGVWMQGTPAKGHRLTLGGIDKVSPRGFTEWYSLTEAIGLAGMGVTPEGEPSAYHEQVETKGLLVAGYENTVLPGIRLSYWSYYLHNLFTMQWAQVDYHHEGLILGAQLACQQPQKAQRNQEQTTRYMQPNERGVVASVQAGWQGDHIHLTAAALRSFSEGRFLWPKELGREDFYVSQPRAWIDGLGDAKVYSLKGVYKGLPHGGWNMKLQLSRYDLPAADELNKYRRPSFYQVLAEAGYTFGGRLKGLELTFLYIGRYSPAEETPALAQNFYRTNFHHLNLVTNIVF
ncbi:OprD family outer membrane porin [Roseivirga sp. BDSF3-8]|uniref:OprD family outer membrane porin n=1 Tax=Roseivirga sp. BDSF3-8 TaxID=3241598 RepID=UPI0035323AA5